LEFGIDREFLNLLAKLLVRIYPLLGYFDGFQPVFSHHRVVPKSRSGGPCFYILDSSNFGIEVKETSSTPQGVPEGLLGVLVAWHEGRDQSSANYPS
jgi:hypothetical protein